MSTLWPFVQYQPPNIRRRGTQVTKRRKYHPDEARLNPTPQVTTRILLSLKSGCRCVHQRLRFTFGYQTCGPTTGAPGSPKPPSRRPWAGRGVAIADSEGEIRAVPAVSPPPSLPHPRLSAEPNPTAVVQLLVAVVTSPVCDARAGRNSAGRSAAMTVQLPRASSWRMACSSLGVMATVIYGHKGRVTLRPWRLLRPRIAHP